MTGSGDGDDDGVGSGDGGDDRRERVVAFVRPERDVEFSKMSTGRLDCRKSRSVARNETRTKMVEKNIIVWYENRKKKTENTPRRRTGEEDRRACGSVDGKRIPTETTPTPTTTRRERAWSRTADTARCRRGEARRRAAAGTAATSIANRLRRPRRASRCVRADQRDTRARPER